MEECLQFMNKCPEHKAEINNLKAEKENQDIEIQKINVEKENFRKRIEKLENNVQHSN